MSQQITLDQITPRMTGKQKFLAVAIFVTAVVILAASYISTGIDPIKLYNKRENAFEYLFGRQITQADKDYAIGQAKRIPAITVFQEELTDLKRENRQKGVKMDTLTLQRRAKERADKRLANMQPAERQAIIDDEYSRILDEKRGGFFPPEMAPANLHSYFIALVETIAIAIWGSLLAVLLSIPISVFAAKNTLTLMVQGEGRTQSIIRWISRLIARRGLDFARGFNEFVMALIFVAVIGLGPFAGVLALFIHTTGILGKVFSEAIEAIEPGQVEAVQASGAGPAQIIAFSVLPQVMPLVVSYSLLRFESNVRSATILGFCGAGGIGFLMFDKINGYLYREVSTMMIMVILSVTIIDYLCGILRSRFQ